MLALAEVEKLGIENVDACPQVIVAHGVIRPAQATLARDAAGARTTRSGSGSGSCSTNRPESWSWQKTEVGFGV